MTLPPVVRVFFAVDPPYELKQNIGMYIGELKQRSKNKAIRWTKPENIHITLQFMAEVRREHLPKLLDNVRAKLKNYTIKSTVSIAGIQVFPHRYRPRVIVLKLEPNQVLADLSALVGQAILEEDYTIDNRPFRGHMTLGRIKQPHGIDLNFLSEVKTPEHELKIKEVVLFRSEPQPEGSEYSVVERLALMQ